MTFPFNHKTVFVLDHGHAFATEADKVEFDFHKARAGGPNYIPSAPISK